MRILLTLLIFAVGIFANPDSSRITLTYGSWNIRWQGNDDVKNGDGWKKRIEPLTNVIRFYDYDIIGLQEGSINKNGDIKPYLTDYDFIQNDPDEHNPILIKKNKFKVLKHGRFYLSETPFKKSKSWDSKHVRYCSWAELEIADVQFFVFNTHFDYHGKKAKLESAPIILKMIEFFSEEKPFILAGDFNSSENSKAYGILVSHPNIKDARYTADFAHQPRNSYNYFDPNRYSPWDLDHIFVNPQIHVFRYGILNETYYDGERFRYPSDHQPLFMKFGL